MNNLTVLAQNVYPNLDKVVQNGWNICGSTLLTLWTNFHDKLLSLCTIIQWCCISYIFDGADRVHLCQSIGDKDMSPSFHVTTNPLPPYLEALTASLSILAALFDIADDSGSTRNGGTSCF